MKLIDRIKNFIKYLDYDPPTDNDWDNLLSELSSKFNKRSLMLKGNQPDQIAFLVNVVEFDKLIVGFNEKFIHHQLKRPKIPRIDRFDSVSFKILLKISYQQFLIWKNLLIYLEEEKDFKIQN